MMLNRADFHESLKSLGASLAVDIFDDLVAAYSETGRHYHSARHIASCLAHFKRFSHLAQRPCEIEIAIWFHDAVYDTKRGDNEDRSAKWAATYLATENVDAKVANRIATMIRQTKNHDATSGDGILLGDIDLGILGASPKTFEAYDQDIRAEYSWVPAEDYRDGRLSVLRSFLDRDFIYKTNLIREQLESQARSNLAGKIAELMK